MYFWFSVSLESDKFLLFFKTTDDVITRFSSSGGGKVVPGQPSEEGPARKGKIKRRIGFVQLEAYMKRPIKS